MWVIPFNVSHMFTVSLFKTLTSLSNIERFACSTYKFINPTVCVLVYCAMYFWFYKTVYSVRIADGNVHFSMLKQIGNLLYYWTVVSKIIQFFELWIVLIFQLGAFKLCCMCEFSFWIKVCEKLLALVCVVLCSILFVFIAMTAGVSVCM